MGSIGMGDIAISKSDPNVIWVGTGENNSSRSSYSGSGVYKSTDGGASWAHMGLINSQHIGRILIHPQDPNTVWIAVIGALYSTNDERGVYKTTDGGKSWNKTLYINDHTGIIDLLIHPTDPNILWACSWERSRRAWEFIEDGVGSSIYKSTDGGKTWNKSAKGLPQASTTGRIGISLCKAKPNVMYACIDNQAESDKKDDPEDSTLLQLTDFTGMSRESLLELADSSLKEFLERKGFPKKYTVKQIKKDVKKGKFGARDIANYFGDANEALFKTKIKGLEIYRSTDGGASWAKTHEDLLEGVYNTYGYYFGEIRVDPVDEQKFYAFGVPLLRSTDGGATFTRLDTLHVHGDHQALWINEDMPDHLILGNDGGLYMSYDGGLNWLHLNTEAVGQFYTVQVDMKTPYNIYGGTQDNGVLRGSHRSIPNRTKAWKHIFGGDGMYIAVDPDDHTVYTGYQFGNYFRLGTKTKRITPAHDIGDPQLRWNWRAPLRMSSHNSEILYIGSQYLHRSMDRGQSWERISDDLTNNKQPQKNVPFSTVSSISESPLVFGTIWVGTDDGNLWLTQSSGASWTLVSKKLPKARWVSRVFASPHDEATAFVSLSGYRSDDFDMHLYRSTDYGNSWESIQGNMPEEPVNVIIQDPVNPDLLYVGTDHSTYISLDAGKSWERLNGIPNTASYDMVVHPRENHLVVATHGRSIYVIDVAPLQDLKGPRKNNPIIAFAIDKGQASDKWGEKRNPYTKIREPEILLRYWIGYADPAPLQIKIMDSEDEVVWSTTANDKVGYHQFVWNMSELSGEKLGTDDNAEKVNYLKKGKYKVVFQHGDALSEQAFEVKGK